MSNTTAGVVHDVYRSKGLPRSYKTGFTYTSRSYDVEASTEIVQPPPGHGYRHVFAYSHTEIGYEVEVSCMFSTSS